MAQLTREIATMATNMRIITRINMVMQELLMQMQGQRGPPIPHFESQEYYPREDEV